MRVRTGSSGLALFLGLICFSSAWAAPVIEHPDCALAIGSSSLDTLIPFSSRSLLDSFLALAVLPPPPPVKSLSQAFISSLLKNPSKYKSVAGVLEAALATYTDHQREKGKESSLAPLASAFGMYNKIAGFGKGVNEGKVGE